MTEKEDTATLALLEFLNAVEAGVIQAKQMIADDKKVAVRAHAGTLDGSVPVDFDQMFWETKQGTRGEYQQTSRSNNKVEAFDALKEMLKTHGNFMRHKGYQYWFDRDNEDVIDRRKK